MEQIENEYYFEKLEESKLRDLQYLFKETFKVDFSIDEIKKKHLYCHGHVKYVGFLAYHSVTKEPAAFYGVFPIEVTYKDKKELAAQSGDTMTHPNHQKKGLFVQLARITFDFCRENGIQLIFGFPNKSSYPGFIKHLNFVELDKMLNFTLCENKWELTRFSLKNRWLSRWHSTYIQFYFTKLLTKGIEFENSNKRDVAFACLTHDVSFFHQKKSETKFFLNIKGINVWVAVSQNQLAIGDIDTSDPEKLKKVIRQLQKITFWVGLRFLSFGGSKSAVLVRELEGFGYQSKESYLPIFLNFYSTIPLEKITFLNSDVDVF